MFDVYLHYQQRTNIKHLNECLGTFQPVFGLADDVIDGFRQLDAVLNRQISALHYDALDGLNREGGALHDIVS